MKVNTDGVILGAYAYVNTPTTILDIGTGTGVIALMLAQRFTEAQIDAVEIEPLSAQTALENFQDSPFKDRVRGYISSFEDFFEAHPKKTYDLIVSNPPFFIDALESRTSNKKVARHTNEQFFERLLQNTIRHLTEQGALWLVLPLATAKLVEQIAKKCQLVVQHRVWICSFAESQPHRVLIALGLEHQASQADTLTIYQAQKQYTTQYARLLKDFLTIF